jgi:hypothetical protein
MQQNLDNKISILMAIYRTVSGLLFGFDIFLVTKILFLNYEFLYFSISSLIIVIIVYIYSFYLYYFGNIFIITTITSSNIRILRFDIYNSDIFLIIHYKI